MKAFDYYRAESPADVIGTDARPIAGGTNLLDLMKHQVETPDRLADVNHVGLDGIERDGDGLRVGALVLSWRRSAARCEFARHNER